MDEFRLKKIPEGWDVWLAFWWFSWWNKKKNRNPILTLEKAY